MSRYLVELEGHITDVEEFLRWFPSGDVHAVRENEQIYLMGEAFDSLIEPKLVLTKAEQVLDEFFAVILLYRPSLRRPALGAVCVEDECGQRKCYSFVSIVETIRMKDSMEIIGPEGTTDGLGQRLLDAYRQSRSAQAAMMIWADPIRTWPRLYRVLEELEDELEATVDKFGLCSSNQRERFTRSANSAAVAGKDSRHAANKFCPPKNPMTLSEATSFVGDLILQTLQNISQRSAEGFS